MKVALPCHGELTTTRTLFEFFTGNKEEENGLCGLGLVLYQLDSRLKPCIIICAAHFYILCQVCDAPGVEFKEGR